MKPILEVQNVWKAYQKGGKQPNYLNIREQIKNFLLARPKKETFWALKDISFSVQEGECIGIIGKNGAGKSTLLKILSKITPPTKGQIKARGRVASLLEVGTGFHQELTGRENIFLNGSILGLQKTEINQKLDAIINFSGVESFLNTPLKHYSSGMKLRLAFSVAAHLEPEILLIDEVLAVGDAEFQKKCLGKMNEVSQNGRTVLFVSHNLSAVKQLCQKSILILDGKIQNIGQTDSIITDYLSKQKLIAQGIVKGQKLNNYVIIKHFTFTPNKIETGDKINFQFEINFLKSNNITDLVCIIYNDFGVRVANIDLFNQLKKQSYKSLAIKGTIQNVPLIEGQYHVGIYINSSLIRGDYFSLSSFSITDKESPYKYNRANMGVIKIQHQFSEILIA